MKALIFDIETIQAPESSYEALRYLYNRKIEKKHQKMVAEGTPIVAETPEQLEAGFKEFIAGTSFDGAFGRVLCIAYAINDGPIEVICNPDNEAETVRKFWEVAANIDVFVGHNIMEFDLRFLLQRSIMLGVKPSWARFQEVGRKPWEMGKYLSFARYNNLPIFDTMHEWSNWGNNKMGIEHLALAMGIPTPKEGIDGSQVHAFFLDGKVADICDYCKRDVETTRAVYKRMRQEDVNAAPF